MSKQIIIAEKNHIAAVFADDQIQELVVATGNQQVGDIYLGTVENVISGIDAAFVNIGDAEKNGFIHVTDLGPLRLRRNSAPITELLSPHQQALVQVMKEPTGNKGPRLTGNISLPGRYLVLMPYGKGVSLSRRIKNEHERNRLRALSILSKPAGMGLLVRTEAEGKAEETILEDLDFLQKQWEKIKQEANSVKAPALLNRDDDFIQRVLRDMYNDQVNRIVVDSENAVKRVKKQLNDWSASRHPSGVVIECHQGYTPILDYFRVNAAIKEALKPRVDLPSGGYIIIEPTEALTVIDVNSGSFTHSATSRQTVSWTNREAAVEIARQLKLRNIGGVIIIDFIDMDSRKDKLDLIQDFEKALKSDKAAPQIAQLTELGLVELTRKRQGKNIYELFGQTCSHCGGLGLMAHLPGHQEVETVTNFSQPVISKGFEKPTIDEKPILSDDGDAAEVDNDLNGASEGDNGNGRRRRRRRDGVVNKDDVNTNNGYKGGNDEGEGDSPKPERKERTYLSRSARRDESKLEKVVVKMSEAEQDIYAMMGVSPLLHLEREIKDPKSVLIYVQSPDESGVEEENHSADERVVEDSEVIFSSSSVEMDGDSGEMDSDGDDNSSLPLFAVEATDDGEAEEVEETPIFDEDGNADHGDDDAEVISPKVSEPETIAEAVVKEALSGDRPVVRTRRRRSKKTEE
ncbi:ribonuclease, Rne/Rng family [Cyanobacterium stanieri PCC 7202]|uniref:Ribonuclease, Rne/Rng family n=1 Tax=Cyanobacterium stanieri (strain ATCC 29140 / PCC 7202) TaxID=292563 RepID=K9YJN8_CYASC|nr:ribonuclease, Rne/Rng family [Cyanobacterium stanieri PCC 7202]